MMNAGTRRAYGFRSRGARFLPWKRVASVWQTALLSLATILAPLQLTFQPQIALATRGYEASVNKPSLDLSMSPGETRTVILTYTNTGTVTWFRDAKTSYVSLYLAGKTSSPLRHASWRTSDSPARISDVSVAPGKSTTVLFHVSAPSASGTYTETFRLAAEDTAWMYGSETTVTVRVSKGSGTAVSAPLPPSAPAPATAPASQPVANGSGNTMKAVLLLRSEKSLTLGGDESKKITLGFKNSGSAVWKNMAIKVANVQAAMTNTLLSVYHPSWTSSDTPANVDAVTNPGEIGFITFTLQAPPKRGTYTVRVQLVANGANNVEGGFVDIPVTVTSDGAVQLSPPIVPPTAESIPKNSAFIANEPIIRVGLFRTVDDQMIIGSLQGSFHLFQNGKTVCAFQHGEEVKVRFDRVHGVYQATGPRCNTQSTDVYQIQSLVGPWEPLVMTDFDRPVSWLPGANDNTFRGILELRWSGKDVWPINELPMELYLRGIAETSDVSPLEYQKALLIAARTYAYYHWKRGTKHAVERFHVDGKYDQVYRGYGAEIRSPKIVRAVTETRGQIVTYNGALAITPYFSRSDGRTRSWEEVWYGDPIPWLRGVSVPWDNGKTLWGHGVGMSASGALGMANDGKGYADILKHFYTGIELQLFY